MEQNILKKIILISVLLFVFIQNADAVNISGTGRAVIEKNDLRSAKKQSLNNALLNCIKSYYKSLDSSTIDISDVSPEYLMFIRSYKVIFSKVVGSSIVTKVNTVIDEVALTDAMFLIDNPVNSAVFAYRGLPINNINLDMQANIINNILNANSFSTFEQKSFKYSVSDISNFSAVTNAFNTVDSKYLFEFSFNFKQNNLEDPENMCELTTTTSIIAKHEPTKVLKIDIGSTAKDIRACTNEVLNKSITHTIDYIRSNVIEKPIKNETINTYQLKVVNFKNFISVNKLLEALKERRVLKSFQAVSFSAKQMLIKIETPFTLDEFGRKMAAIFNDIRYSIEINDSGMVLDFDPIISDPTVIDNSTFITEESL